MDRFADLSRYSEVDTVPGAVILRIEAGLFYFNAQNVKKGLLERMRQRGRVDYGNRSIYLSKHRFSRGTNAQRIE